MRVHVIVSAPLRSDTDARASMDLSGTCVREVLGELCLRFPALRGKLFADENSLRRTVLVHVNGEDVRSLGGLDTGLEEGDTVSLLLAVAGG